MTNLNNDDPLSYDEAKALASHTDVQVRRQLAARGDIKPEILYFLAEDPDAMVRRHIAGNSATPYLADLLLARDADDEVRTSLAAKVARLAPGLSEDERDKVHSAAFDALTLLARDEVVRVRQVLAETLKDMTDAPPSVIRQLARDAELAVSGPILEYSPVLSDADLLDIIRAEMPDGCLSAIARRAGLGGDPAQAIVERGEVEAVTELLGNDSAQIREETLDLILDRAPEIEAWHAPMVRRTSLPPGAVQRMAEFVVANMLDVLSQRSDLDAETAAVVREEVERRLADEDSARETPFEAAQALLDKGELGDEAVLENLKMGRRPFVIAALSLLSGLSADVIEKIVASGSAKGTVALTWKAGLSPRTGTELQQKVTRVPHGDLLYPKGGEDFPMSEADMTWQLDFFQE